MDVLDMVYDKVCCELDEIMKKEKLDSKDVELIGEFVDIMKDINQIDSNQDQMTGSSYMRGRSGRMMPMYGRGGSYGRGFSYMRDTNNGYSRDESKEMMLEHLQQVMDMAVDEKDRRAVGRLMEQMEQQR